MFISSYYISCHQLRVYKDHNHDVFRKVYIYTLKVSNYLLKTYTLKTYTLS